jgi:hypothetical protein
MEQQQDITKRYRVGSAVCCFALAGFMVLTLVAWPQRLSAVLSTAAFILIFTASGVLYLLRWRRMVKTMWGVLLVFWLVALSTWWVTGQQPVGLLPCLLIVLLSLLNRKLASA